MCTEVNKTHFNWNGRLCESSQYSSTLLSILERCDETSDSKDPDYLLFPQSMSKTEGINCFFLLNIGHLFSMFSLSLSALVYDFSDPLHHTNITFLWNPIHSFVHSFYLIYIYKNFLGPVFSYSLFVIFCIGLSSVTEIKLEEKNNIQLPTATKFATNCTFIYV